MGEFQLRVVGTHFDNDDGSSRMEEIDACAIGDEVHLVRERQNRFDPSAVAVVTERWVRIGYIGADRCGWIGSKIDRGYTIRATINRLPYHDGGSVVLAISMARDGPETAPPIASRRPRAGAGQDRQRCSPGIPG